MNRIMDERVNGMNIRDGYKVALNGTNWDEVRNENNTCIIIRDNLRLAYVQIDNSCISRPNTRSLGTFFNSHNIIDVEWE